MRRLRRPRDIRAVYAAGTFAHGPALTAHVRRRGDDDTARIAVVAGRKVGGAVERNRAKRRLRAALAATPLSSGTDIVVVARRPAVSVAFDRLSEQVDAVITKAGRRRPSSPVSGRAQPRIPA
jgi:ribonuclease P protein component